MTERTTIRGGSERIQTHLDDVPGEESLSEKDKRRERQNAPDHDFEPASEQEVYESAERAKADFMQAAEAAPEATEEELENTPPAQERAQRKVAQERRSG